MFPVNGGWSSSRPSRQETVRYYHATKKCLTNRFPFFRLSTWKFLLMLKIAFKIHRRSISQASLGWHSNKTWDYVPVCERTFLVLVPQLPHNSSELSVVKSWAKAALFPAPYWSSNRAHTITRLGLTRWFFQTADLLSFHVLMHFSMWFLSSKWFFNSTIWEFRH